MMERRELWDHLCSFSCSGVSWVVLGDFNNICSDDEWVGGNPRVRVAIEEFNSCINSCGLIDWKLEGKQLSWCNGQQGMATSWAKLDRVLVNNVFVTKFGGAVAHLLSRRTLDHSPILF
ncbi:hypothetical protein CIPAW_10G100000 [Carya illinoinensis]|uniref:Uncharacterized protein n=1 Tax=Carya illinoinensis TaxID=32201 RepID=A0A8T1PCJ9_CARIL|nr:hypothetical protein CIPAW_10G100000 [Carya illinoinensis]